MPRKINPGIYMILHNSTGKKYIGSSVTITERFLVHKRQLRKNMHCNRHLQNSWNKHGEVAFSFTVLEENLSRDVLESRENFYIVHYGIADPETNIFFEDKGFNMCWAGREGFKDPSRQKRGEDHHLYGKTNWKKGKTFVELFGKERADELKLRISLFRTGKESPKKFKHKTTWENMSYNRQYKLWKNDDPLVPENWVPKRKQEKV